MPRSWHDELLASGVRLVIFNPPLPALLRTAIWGEDSSSSQSSRSSSLGHAMATARLALVYCRHLFSSLLSSFAVEEAPSRSLPGSSLDPGRGLSSVHLENPAEVTGPALPLCAERVGPVPFRDHRKSLVIDGETAFVGSLNVSEDAVGMGYDGALSSALSRCKVGSSQDRQGHVPVVLERVLRVRSNERHSPSRAVLRDLKNQALEPAVVYVPVEQVPHVKGVGWCVLSRVTVECSPHRRGCTFVWSTTQIFGWCSDGVQT